MITSLVPVSIVYVIVLLLSIEAGVPTSVKTTNI